MSETLIVGGGYLDELGPKRRCDHAVQAWVDGERLQFGSWKRLMERVRDDCFGAGAGAGATALRDGTAYRLRSSAVLGDMENERQSLCLSVKIPD